MNIHPEFLLWLAPTVYLLASLGGLLLQGHAWRIAHAASLIALGSAVIVGIWSGTQLASDTGDTDAIGAVMLLLITTLGWIIIRYSRTYLAGEKGQLRYVTALLFTLAAVAVVVLTQHLGILFLAWFASSLGLHRLLTFYRQRLQAQLVAHKKFLASRMAELCLLIALLLIYSEFGTLTFEGIAGQVQNLTNLPDTLQFAAGLIAVAVILKSAQLPLHGWLIQVMEAPTPVSALLHAGVVNIGGFVLIRLAELISAAPIAQALLVVMGGLTTVLAGLVMMTRVSIKVRLAWSTCAQMGFMLMECGLGLYELAFLHLIAHSFYKAYAFLSAGDAVLEVRQQDLMSATGSNHPDQQLWRYVMALPVSLLLVVGSIAAWQFWLIDPEIPVIALLIVTLGLAPLLWQETQPPGFMFIRGMLGVLVLTQLYIIWHTGFAEMVPAKTTSSQLLIVFTGICFALLHLLQIWLLAWPRGRIAAVLYPWVYAGFYLDERFTRLTFRIWPPRLQSTNTNSVSLSPSFAKGEKA